jgi:hypothetical protein
MPPRDMGVSTSSATFFRSMGGTFGAAIAISILFNSVGGNIQRRFTELQHSNPGALRAALGSLSKAQLAKLQSAGGQGNSQSLNNTDFIGSLPHTLQNVFLSGFADSMRSVYLISALIMVPAFVFSFFIREIPLRAAGGLAAAHAEAAVDEIDGTKVEVAAAPQRGTAAQYPVRERAHAGADATRPEVDVECLGDVARSETTTL